jgi:cephalosporin-C deacetylase
MKRHEHLVEFDLPIEELEVYRPERVEPPDFDAFWDRTLREVGEHGLDAELNPVQTPLTTLDVYDVRFAGHGGDPIHGWLLRDPREPAGGPCVVQFLGYGSGRGHALDHLDWPSVGYQTLVVETRGQGAGALEGTTADPHPSHPHVPGWLTQGIREPDTYYYRRVFVDAVRAVELARTHPAIAADRVVVSGTSQGGAIALAATALCPVDALVANVPFGCNFERGIRITDEAPYSEVADYLRLYRSERDQVLRTLSYFDGMNFAVRAKAPALFSLGLMDRVSPPSTVFAAYNHYAGPREMRVWPYNGHEGGETDQQLEAIAFLADVLAVDPPALLTRRL